MINEIFKEEPTIEAIVKDPKNDITVERVLELNQELIEECCWCPFDGPCTICGGLTECLLNETIDWEEEFKALREWERSEEARKLNEIEYDEWANNIGECEAHFWGVCQGKERGMPCEKPSEYGCCFRQ